MKVLEKCCGHNTSHSNKLPRVLALVC